MTLPHSRAVCMRSSFPAAAAVALAALALIAGCGRVRPTTVRVRGTVHLDGEPVPGAAVLFQPTPGVPARAITADDGTFELTTFSPGDGAIVGRHRVAVGKFTMMGVTADDWGVSGPVAAGGVKETWVTPQRYATPADSGLEIDVKPGMAAVVLELRTQ